MAPRNPLEEFRALTDPAEQAFVKSKRGLVENEKILDQLDAFRAKRAAEAPPPEPTAPLDPHFASWLNEAKPLNPDYSDEQLKDIYDRTYAAKDTDLLSYQDFVEKAKPLNPEYSEEDLRAVWKEQYASRGALEENPGFGGTLLEGAKQTGRSLKAFGQALVGDTAGAEATADASTSAIRDPALVRLLRDINRRKEELGPDASWFDAGSAVGKALLNDPKGAALLLAEQLPNSAAALGAAGAGALAGSAFGPVGTAVGGLAGLFVANVGLETGGKVIEKAQGGLTPTERLDALDEGLKKGAVITGIDAATFGATKWLTGAATRAMERATVRTLEHEGVDVTDKTAIDLARQRPDLVERVQAAQKEALQHVNTLGQRTARGTSEVALQTIGEGAGEYIGEMVATGHGDKVESFIEAFAGLGQSIGEIGIASAMDGKRAVTELFGSGSQIEKPEIQDILKQPDVDSAIAAATGAAAGDTAVTPEKIDAFLGEAVTKPTDVTASHLGADQTTVNKLFTIMKDAGAQVSSRGDGTMLYRGLSSKVLDPKSLPDERGAAGFVTKGQYEAIEVVLQSMGKHLIVLDSPLAKDVRFQGMVLRTHFPSTVFLSNVTQHDPVAVAFHEVGHLMEGSPLYQAFQQTVQDNLRPSWKQEAAQQNSSAMKRGGTAALLHEVSADILGDAMMRPDFMEKVVKNLQLQIGPEAAQQEAVTFLDKIKAMIKRVHAAVLGHTFKTKNGRDAANAYVKNLEAVHESLAKAIAAEFKQREDTTIEATPITEERVEIDPTVGRAFQNVGEVDYPVDAIKAVQDAGGAGDVTAVTQRVGSALQKLTSQAVSGVVPTAELKADIDAALKIIGPSGFDRKSMDHVLAHATRTGQDPTAVTKGLTSALTAFAKGFKGKQVYNKPQWLAKHAAIAIGDRRWGAATQYLKELKTMLDTPGFTTEALAHDLDGGEVRRYARPAKVQAIESEEAGDGFTDPEYLLDEPVEDLEAGKTVKGSDLARKGYAPQVTKTIKADEAKAKTTKKAEKVKKTETTETTEKTEKPKAEEEVIVREEADEESREEGQEVTETATVDDAASDVNPNPTDAQKDAGNFKKGHITINGLNISIENPEGSTRRGVDRSGKAWSVEMTSHYGYIRGTQGKDKDHLDVYVKPGTTEDYDGMVYVIDQIAPGTKQFDEHKIILGALTSTEAKDLYLSNYPKGWKGLGAITSMPMDTFKAWLEGDTTQPAEYKARPIAREFQRYEDGSDPVGSPNKPHGLYVSPGDIDSPHKDLGGARSTWKLDDDAKILFVEDHGKETALRKDALGADAGVEAVYTLLGADVFARLKEGSKADAIAFANEHYPGPDYTKYFDKQEVLMAIGAQEARKQGYDAIYSADDPKMAAFRGDFTEIVLLNDKKAHRTDTKKDLVPVEKKQDAGLLSKPLPKTEKPLTVTTTRSVGEISREIFERENELYDQGLDTTKMYNPLDSRDDVLRKRKGYEAMPEDLAKLHLERDAARKNEPQFSTRTIPAAAYAVSEPGKLDAVVRVLADKDIDILRMVQAIQDAGGQIPSQLNPALHLEMQVTRAAERSKDYTTTELLPMLEVMRENNVTLEQVNSYAHARHVITDKVNKRLQEMNPDMPNNESLSGLSDAEAKKILAGYTGGRKAVMDQLMARIDAMVEKTRDMAVHEYGIEKAETIAGWRETYQAYVPLRREAFDEEGQPSGTGKSVRGSIASTRLGSNLKVGDILANIAQARDHVIEKGEKNRIGTAMAGLLMMHPNKEIAVLDKPAQVKMIDPSTGLEIDVPGDLANYRMPKIRKLDHKTGENKWYPDPTYKGHENVVNFRVKGIDYAIVFNQKSARAREMAKAFRETDTAKLTGVLKAIAPYTRYLASINTQYNPIFGVVNFTRDAQFAMLALSSTPLAGKQVEVINNARKSLIGIYQDARDSRHGLPPSSDVAQLMERFKHVGGPTGVRDLFMTTTDRAEEIQRLLNPNSFKHLKSAQALGRRLEDTAMFKLLSDYNLTMENAIRLGVFKTAVDMGIDDLQAASYAKNITVNFNKKGQIGAQMGAAYAFFNANVRGTVRIAETMFERDKQGGHRLSAVGKKIVVGGLLVGVLQTFLLAMFGFDDDEPPDFVKEKNFVVPIPGTDKLYFPVAMPLGFNILPNVGRIAAETSYALMRGKDPKIFKHGADLFHTIMSSLSPVGGSASPALEVMPTVADPIISLELNKDWRNKRIFKEDIDPTKPTTGVSRAGPNATPWATGLAQMINWAMGGTDHTPGILSPTPDAIDYLIQQATGGVGREIVVKPAKLLKSAQTGEDLPIHQYPIFGRFIGSASGTASIRDKFYDNIRAINLAAGEVEGRAKNHEERGEFLKDHPEAAFAKSATQMQRAIGELQDAKRLAIEKGAPKDAIKLREERINALMKQFNDAVERRKKGDLR